MIEMALVDLPYIEKNPSRHGVIRYFFRFKGKRICRLPDAYGSEEFLLAYWAARKSIERPPEPSMGQPRPFGQCQSGTFQWLCLEYMRTSDFLMLDRTTQAKRRAIIESMWAEPLSATDPRLVADVPVNRMNSSHIEVLRDRKRATPFAADERLKVLRQIFAVRSNGQAITPNIARDVAPFRVSSDGHIPMTPEELGQYIQHHGTKSKAVLAIALLAYTGIRVSDLAAIGPQHRRNDRFKLRLFKNRNRAPVTIELDVHPILAGVLSMHAVRGMTYLVTEFGKPFSVKGLGNRVGDWFRQAGLEHLTAHSVRKGLATDQAHNGATDSMLEAMFGWTDGKTSKIYTRNADRARLARIAVSQINWDGVGNMLVADCDESEARTVQEQ